MTLTDKAQVLDGTLCVSCGAFIGQCNGYPERCRECAETLGEYEAEEP